MSEGSQIRFTARVRWWAEASVGGLRARRAGAGAAGGSAGVAGGRAPRAPGRAIAIASSRPDGGPVAYAVIDRVEGVAYVRDIFGRREALGWLLDLLVPALYPRG